MSSLIALTEDARRRAEKAETSYIAPRKEHMSVHSMETDRLLLFAVILILLHSDANIILLLAILYVAL